LVDLLKSSNGFDKISLFSSDINNKTPKKYIYHRL